MSCRCSRREGLRFTGSTRTLEYCPQHSITGEVTIRIVDLLEVVQINQRDGKVGTHDLPLR
jgi:hypothetical protein